MADQASTLIATGFITAMIGMGILGARFIILQALEKAYCVCGHEFNEHYVLPHGFAPLEGWPETEKCKRCGCRAYIKNAKDERNTP